MTAVAVRKLVGADGVDYAAFDCPLSRMRLMLLARPMRRNRSIVSKNSKGVSSRRRFLEPTSITPSSAWRVLQGKTAARPPTKAFSGGCSSILTTEAKM